MQINNPGDPDLEGPNRTFACIPNPPNGLCALAMGHYALIGAAEAMTRTCVTWRPVLDQNQNQNYRAVPLPSARNNDGNFDQVESRNQSMSAFPCLQSRWTLERCSNGNNTTESEVWYL